MAVATSDKSVPVISNEKFEVFDPDVIVKAYVPGSSFVRLILVIPSAFAASTPLLAVLMDVLILSIAAKRSVETPSFVVMSWNTVPPSIVVSINLDSVICKFKIPLSPLYSTLPSAFSTKGLVFVL